MKVWLLLGLLCAMGAVALADEADVADSMFDEIVEHSDVATDDGMADVETAADVSSPGAETDDIENAVEAKLSAFLSGNETDDLETEDDESKGKIFKGYVRVPIGEKHHAINQKVHNLHEVSESNEEVAKRYAAAEYARNHKRYMERRKIAKAEYYANEAFKQAKAAREEAARKRAADRAAALAKAKADEERRWKEMGKTVVNDPGFDKNKWDREVARRIASRMAFHNSRAHRQWEELGEEMKDDDEASKRRYRWLARKIARKIARRGRRAARAARRAARMAKLAAMSKTDRKIAKKKVLPCKALRCKARALAKESRKWKNRKHNLQKTYQKSYRRYQNLVSRYYRRKYRMLAVKYVGEHRQNTGLKKALWNLVRRLADTRRFKALQRVVKNLKDQLLKANKFAEKQRKTVIDLRNKLALSKKAFAELKKLHSAAHVEIKQHKRAHAVLMAKHHAAFKSLTKANAGVRALEDQLAAANRKIAALAASNKQCAAEGVKLRAQVKDLKRPRDACGVSNGNEQTCAKKRTPASCHSVGDPHMRTFDGYTYDYHVDGEFVLAKHAFTEEFEVQTQQRRCPNPHPRCNSGMAVKADGHIIITYRDWGLGSILVDGRKVTPAQGRRVAVTKDLSYTRHATGLFVRYKDALARGYHRNWGNGYMDIYVTVPARWSSGRSMTGLCYDNDNNGANDRALLGRVRNYWVRGTAQSLFKNPRLTAADEDEDIEVAAPGDDGVFEDKVGGPDPVALKEHDEVKIGTHDGKSDEAKLKESEQQEEAFEQLHKAVKGHAMTDGNKDENRLIANADPEHRKLAKSACGKHAHGQDRKDCEADILAGEPTKVAVKNAVIANLIDHERMLGTCVRIQGEQSATYQATMMPKHQNGEGYSFALWYQPLANPSGEAKNIFSKGDGFKVNEANGKIQVSTADATCTTSQSVKKGEWAQYVITLGADGELKVYVNDVLGCTANGEAPQPNDFALVVGDSSPPAEGRIARLFYAPLTVTAESVKRYAHRKTPTCVL